MRILYVINSFDPGGAEHGLLTLLENGFFDGHELVVLGLCRGRGQLADRVREVVGPGSFRIACDVELLSLRVVAAAARVLFDELRNRRPDVVILSLKQTNIVGRMVLNFFPAVRCISFEHIMKYRSRRFQWVYKYILWLLSIRVGEVWGDCQTTIDATARYFMPVRRRATNVVPLFCVPDNLAVKTDYATKGPFRIAVAGRLSRVKNIDKLVAVVDQLRQNGMDVRLDVFGSGPEELALQQQIESCALEGHVRLLGHRQAWFNDATTYDLLVNASDTEGFCIVVAEAMSVGLPTLSTNVGGIREYGVDGVNMMKLTSFELPEFVARITRLADDEQLREALGRRAAADIRRDYSAASIKRCGHRILGR